MHLREMKQLQKLLLNETNELWTMINTIDSEFIRIICDPDMTVTDFNDRALECFGMTNKQLAGMKITDIMPPEELPAFEEDWKKILEGEIVKGKGERTCSSGTERIWYMYSPLKDISGTIGKVMILKQIIC
jgi:PAS domain S-box-containing protein